MLIKEGTDDDMAKKTVFFCKECGMIMDVDCCKDFYPDKQLDGARVDSMSLIMNGVCKNCLT